MEAEILKETVEKWIEDGVVVASEGGHGHNDTLTMASKKDMFGMKTKKRVCLDSRPLNAYLDGD